MIAAYSTVIKDFDNINQKTIKTWSRAYLAQQQYGYMVHVGVPHHLVKCSIFNHWYIVRLRGEGCRPIKWILIA